MSMKKNICALLVAASVTSAAFAGGAEDDLLGRNRALDVMRYNRDKLKVQAEMAKAYKDMKDAGFIVDENGMPLGVDNMESLATNLRNRESNQANNASDPFSGADPVNPVPTGQNNLFGGESSFQPPAAPKAPKVEVVSKPSADEKAQGKRVLRLVELRGNRAVFFTNDGYKEVAVGESVYDEKLNSIGVDSATLRGKDGKRIVRIDWTRPVRYSDN